MPQEDPPVAAFLEPGIFSQYGSYVNVSAK
jgi:hypothetical protein